MKPGDQPAFAPEHGRRIPDMRKDGGHRLPLVDIVPEGGEPIYHEVSARDLREVTDLHQQPKALVDRTDDCRNVVGNVLPFFGWDPRERFQDSGNLGVVDPPAM